jgi:hypothetical protein
MPRLNRRDQPQLGDDRVSVAHGQSLRPPSVVAGLLGRHIGKPRVADELTILSDRQPRGSFGEFLTAHNDLLLDIRPVEFFLGSRHQLASAG